jgi:hypothetical protein
MTSAPTPLHSAVRQCMQAAGNNGWRDMVDGVDRRVSPDQINISQKGF